MEPLLDNLHLSTLYLISLRVPFDRKLTYVNSYVDCYDINLRTKTSSYWLPIYREVTSPTVWRTFSVYHWEKSKHPVSQRQYLWVETTTSHFRLYLVGMHLLFWKKCFVRDHMNLVRGFKRSGTLSPDFIRVK